MVLGLGLLVDKSLLVVVVVGVEVYVLGKRLDEDRSRRDATAGQVVDDDEAVVV